MTYLNCLFCNGGYSAGFLNHCTWRIFWSSQKEHRESIEIMGTEPRCLDFQFSLSIKAHDKTPLLEIVRWTCFFHFLLLTRISDQPQWPHFFSASSDEILTLSWWKLISTFILIYSYPQWVNSSLKHLRK